MTNVNEHRSITLFTPLNSAKPKGIKAWHCLLAAFIADLVLGVLIAL